MPFSSPFSAHCPAFVSPFTPSLHSFRRHRNPSIISLTRRSPVSPPKMAAEKLILRTSPRWLTLEPTDTAIRPTHMLYIDRSTLTYSLRDRVECAALAEPDSETLIYGLVGLLESLHDLYLLVITRRIQSGTILEAPVYRVAQLSAIPVRGPKMLKKMMPELRLTKKNLQEEATMYGMINAAVSLPGFYYSHAMDLTRSAQKRADVAATSVDAPARTEFERADLRFVWNRYAAKTLLEVGAVGWVVPLILGYVDVRTGMVNGKWVSLALVSRRGADRPGLRYTARGADVHGNCSNFVETEQIVWHGEKFSSYVQVRGSIPLLWRQEANIKYKPKAELKEVDGGGKGGLCQTAFEKHFEGLMEIYGGVTAVSLIENRGSEGVLYSALREAVDLMGGKEVRVVMWDFHKKCAGMKYEKVEHDLLPMLEEDLRRFSYFYSKEGGGGEVTKRQRGVVRTNCIDSLDRTNVVQSCIAHRIMDAALKVMGVLDSSPESCTVAKFDGFEKEFKNTWADHANAISRVYAGSGALKTDYTRTGKRSKGGMVQDGVRAIRRYVYQNFLDGQRQDGIDLLLGVVSLPKSVSGPRELALIGSKAEPLVVKEKYLPHLFFLCLTLMIVGLLIPNKMKTKMVLVGIGGGGMAVFGKLILNAGHKLAARPKLDGTN